MSDIGAPIDAYGAVERFGNPYHGWVRGGLLTIHINGATKPWVQPELDPALFRHGYIIATAGAPAPYQFWEPERFGYTSYLKFLGATPLANLPPPDAASGKEWMNQALISGPRRQLYGKNLTGWVWERNDKIVFVVGTDLNEQTAYTWTDPLDINITFTPATLPGPSILGTVPYTTITPPPSKQTFKITLTDFGQSPATPYIDFLDEPTFGPGGVAHPEYHKAWLTIVDISPTGRYVILEVSSAAAEQHVDGIYGTYYGGTWRGSGIQRGVLAYLKIDLGVVPIAVGDVSAMPSISVLKNRNQVFGPLGRATGNLDSYYGRLQRACFTRIGDIVFFELRCLYSGVTYLTVSCHLINAAGLEIANISMSFSNPLAGSRSTNYSNLSGSSFGMLANGADPNSRTVNVSDISWSNNLVGFLSGSDYRTPSRIYHGKLLTPEGPVTLPDGVYGTGPQYGSYCAYEEFGTLSTRVRFAETSPVCWV